MIDLIKIEEEIYQAKKRCCSMSDVERLLLLYQLKEHMEEDEDEDDEELTMQEAVEWTSHMVGVDPEHMHGARWTPEEIKAVVQKMGWKMDAEDFPEFYAIMNAMYADYAAVAKKHNVSTPEFYAEMAYAWLHDPDAKEGKARRYWRHVAGD